MSSYQIVGALAGFVLGDFSLAGLSQGFLVGGTIGALLDPQKGPDQVGPRLTDLSVQTSTYGVPIPRVYGKFATQGNILWLENNALKEVVTKKKVKSGGKGGGSKKVTVTTYSYFATFAMGICEGPIDQIAKIWIGGKLFYDGGSPDRTTIIFSQRNALNFTVYNGSNTQTADTRMQASLGYSNVPAYRGLAYIVFYDLPLKEYGNSLQSLEIKVEVLTTGLVTNWTSTKITTNTGRNVQADGFPYIISYENGLFRVGAQNFDKQYQYSVTGNYINEESCSVPFINYSYDGYQFGIGKMNGLDYWMNGLDSPTTKTVATGTYGKLATVTFPGINSPDIIGLAIANDNNSILILHNPVGSLVTCWGWYDYNRLLLRSGVCDRLDEIFAYGRCTISQYAASSFDSKNMMFGFIYGAVDGSARVWKIGNDNVMRRIAYIFGVTSTAFSHPACWMEDNIFYTFDGTCFSIVKPGYVYPISLPLSNVVTSECKKSSILEFYDIDSSDLTQIVPGYRITQVVDINTSIKPLQNVYQFDVYQSGYKIKFKNRGGSPVVTIPISDLGANISNSYTVSIKEEIGDTTTLPTILSIKYINSEREYDVGEQKAFRPTNIENILEVDIPLAITTDSAAKLADILLNLQWLERREFTFTIPMTYWGLEPSDIVVVGNTEFRLTNINYSDTTIECKAKLNKSSIYTSVASGEVIVPTPAEIPQEEGPTIAILIDTSCITSDMNKPCYIAVGTGYLPTWNSGELYTSNDNWQTYTLLSNLSDNNVVGTTSNVIGSFDSTRIDNTSVLNARCIGQLYSITKEQMLNGENIFAYGKDGRWEIIHAATCTLQSDGTYNLSDMLRGRAGTEHNTSNHQIGDYIVELSNYSTEILNTTTSNIGISNIFKAVSPFQYIEDPPEFSFTYTGENLKCLSPVYLSGSINPITGDWTIKWIRRTRVNGEWRDYIDAPISETTEAYEIDIVGSMGSRVYRTLTSTTTSISYSNANQVTDFGSLIPTVYAKVYQISDKVDRGRALYGYIGTYVVPPIIFMSFNGINNSTTIYEEISGQICTITSNAYLSTTQLKFGLSSLRINNIGTYITCASSTGYAIGTSDFTISSWIRLDTSNSYQTIMNIGIYYSGILLRMDNTTRLAIWLNGSEYVATLSAVSLNTWYHIEVSRSGNSLYMFVGGTLIVTHTGVSSINIPTGNLMIGSSAHNTNETLTGYIDELLIYKTCLHTTSFTPPTTPFY